MRKPTFHSILLTLLLIAISLISGCLDSPPLIPERDNPWDPQNPNPPRAPDQFRVFPKSETAVHSPGETDQATKTVSGYLKRSTMKQEYMLPPR